MLSTDKIRQAFLDFFAARQSHIEPSSSLIPVDPSILFTIAGMVPFKKMFLGQENKGYSRAASSQRCLRTNDLDNVGRTARHHTLFEMLGNFSFGDYFKEDAIAWGWEFLTQVMHIAPERLWVTIYTDDEEAKEIWIRKVGIKPERIVKLGEAANFWRMGETGPCGPCSEILIDLGADKGCGKPDCAVGCDCDRYLELWNLVFTQYDQQADGTLKPLPKKNIDTGMGLERLASVIQGKDCNFEIDSIFPIIEYMSRLCGIKYKAGKESDVSLKVIADHLRAITFLISDGVFPANEGRGYVLRRLIRRAIQHGRRLGVEKLFLYQLVGVAVDLLKNPYPELVARREHISQVVKSEEARFEETLEIGSAKVMQLINNLKEQRVTVIPGAEAFKLYDTYGFPLELTKEIAHDEGFTVDEAGFQSELGQQRQRARNTTGFAQEATENQEVFAKLAAELSPTEFTGYQHLYDKAKLLKILRNGKVVSELETGEEGLLVLDRTAFYAESGGQATDVGLLTGKSGEMEITEVKKFGGLFLHHGKVHSGKITSGEEVTTHVEEKRRQSIAIHHTATHLLQAALRLVLGSHIKQSGSLVTPDRLRFDFTHPTALTESELEKTEELVNTWIHADFAVKVDLTSYDDAIKTGTLAFFGEKYDKVVRQVSLGRVSSELCGGTHCARAGEIGLFKISSESSVAAGVRRIEALAGPAAWQKIVANEKVLTRLSRQLTVPVEEIAEKIDKLLADLKQKDKQLEELTTKKALAAAGELLSQVKTINNIKYLATVVEEINAEQLRNLVDDLKNRLQSGVILLLAKQAADVAIVLGVTKDLTPKLNAGKLISPIAQILGGKGGGRPDFAQAGGKDISKIPQAISALEELIKQN